jgi:uncharacterized protein (DUF433 family)
MKTLDWREHITGNPNVLYGKPVLKGTRIPVDLILEKLGHGQTVENLLIAYPLLTSDSIAACLLFAADSVKSDIIYNAA